MIKGLLFDYGGTIDTNGLHWAVVLKNSYQKFDIQVPKDLFFKAYSFGERSLAIHPIVQPSFTFLQVLRAKIEQQFVFLQENGFEIDKKYIELIASDCNEFARQTVQNAKVILEELASAYPLVMVSNFYGNLNAVLEDFEIRHLFAQVVESAVVGVRKPDPAIYALGVKALGFNPEECLVIGDSFSKDIIPAKEIGCRTVWLNGIGWEDDDHLSAANTNGILADEEIKDFSALKKYLVTT